MATHQPAEVRRAQILEAALECFGQKGLHASKMDDIVKASGLSKGAIYFHFDSKDDLFLELFEAFDQAIFAAWEELPDGDALETLRRVGELTLSQLLETRPLLEAWTEFLRHPTSRARMARTYRQARERLGAMVRAGIEAGQIRDCHPEHVASALTALVEGLLLQAFADPEYDALAAWPAAWQLAAVGLAR